jgi:hypothetical protein
MAGSVWFYPGALWDPPPAGRHSPPPRAYATVAPPLAPRTQAQAEESGGPPAADAAPSAGDSSAPRSGDAAALPRRASLESLHWPESPAADGTGRADRYKAPAAELANDPTGQRLMHFLEQAEAGCPGGAQSAAAAALSSRERRITDEDVAQAGRIAEVSLRATWKAPQKVPWMACCPALQGGWGLSSRMAIRPCQVSSGRRSDRRNREPTARAAAPAAPLP